jgi:hypothetical protein
MTDKSIFYVPFWILSLFALLGLSLYYEFFILFPGLLLGSLFIPIGFMIGISIWVSRKKGKIIKKYFQGRRSI